MQIDQRLALDFNSKDPFHHFHLANSTITFIANSKAGVANDEFPSFYETVVSPKVQKSRIGSLHHHQNQFLHSVPIYKIAHTHTNETQQSTTINKRKKPSNSAAKQQLSYPSIRLSGPNRSFPYLFQSIFQTQIFP
jgi:hypothetical protein